MRNLVVFGAQNPVPGVPYPAPPHAVTVDAVSVRCGIIETPDVAFNPDAEEHRHQVLLRVKAFSCNYRDRTIIHSMKHFPAHRFVSIGSEFVGEVCGVGAAVAALQPGDRVISNHHYTGRMRDEDGVLEGVTTNHASKEYLVLHEKKLLKIPDAMPDEVAAAFSLGAQTAYSMVRKLRVEPGMKVLVTSATSNTSLFILGALRQRGVALYAATTSPHFAPRLEALGAQQVLSFNRNGSSFRHSGLINEVAAGIGLFDRVFDPFFDLHLEKAVEVLAPFGMYITCGLARQNEGSAPNLPDVPFNGARIMCTALARNLSILGNCIGLRSDLEQALKDYAGGGYAVPVDSVFTGDDAAGFINRTYNDDNRFGKVAYCYN